jgi:hypothetical protein
MRVAPVTSSRVLAIAGFITSHAQSGQKWPGALVRRRLKLGQSFNECVWDSSEWSA